MFAMCVVAGGAHAYINGDSNGKEAQAARRARQAEVEKRIQEAVAPYSEVIARDPADAMAYYQRGLVYLQHWREERALPDLDQAIRLDPKLARAYCRRGQALHVLRKFEEAYADFDKALELGPDFVPTHLHRAMAYLYHDIPFRFGMAHDPRGQDVKKAHFRKALESAERACALTQFRNPACLEVLAQALADSGDFVAAAKWQDKAITLFPEGSRERERARAPLNEFLRKRTIRYYCSYYYCSYRALDAVRAEPEPKSRETASGK
jgi:tetratricopeptide (TPR) repeat protein